MYSNYLQELVENMDKYTEQEIMDELILIMAENGISEDDICEYYEYDLILDEFDRRKKERGE